MAERCVTIATRQLQLGETQKRVFGLRREWIIDHDVFVITLGVGGAGGETRAPKQRLGIYLRAR